MIWYIYIYKKRPDTRGDWPGGEEMQVATPGLAEQQRNLQDEKINIFLTKQLLWLSCEKRV